MLRQLDENLWCSDASIRLPGGIHMPARMTVVRLPDGLWLHSPLPIDDALAAELAELGEVAHIVAPSLLHHLHAGPASERFSRAKLHAPASLRRKRADLRIDVDLRAGTESWPDIVALPIAGAPTLDEFVFVHAPSRSLIVTDFVFNLHEVQGLMLPMVLRMVGAWRKLAQSKVWRRNTKDRAAAASSARAVLEHEIGRVIPAHGDVLEAADARDQLRGALEWMLSA